MPVRLSPAEARRIAIRAQLLDGSARTVLDTVRQLGFLQLDPTAYVERTQYLVLWSRLGPFDRSELERLLAERRLFDWVAFLYPMEDLAWIRSFMRRWPAGDTAWPRRARRWLEVNEPFRRYVLDELRRRGPLASRELENRAVEPWPSSGWTNDRNVSQLLEFLLVRGEVAVVARRGGQRVYDLAERWYPETPVVADDEADAIRADRRLRALGLDRKGPGVEAEVEGVPGTWRVHPEALETGREPVPERTTLLSPFDRLVHDRDRAEALFGFRYRLEMYVPQAKREFGYFVLPVLHGEELVGRVDVQHVRKERRLVLHRVFEEPGKRVPDLDPVLDDLAEFVGAARE